MSFIRAFGLVVLQLVVVPTGLHADSDGMFDKFSLFEGTFLDPVRCHVENGDPVLILRYEDSTMTLVSPENLSWVVLFSADSPSTSVVTKDAEWANAKIVSAQSENPAIGGYVWRGALIELSADDIEVPGIVLRDCLIDPAAELVISP